jgi:hypothetical protein
MNHLILILVCIVSVEVFIRLNFLFRLDSIHKLIKRVTYVIPQNNISDHWKEKVIPCICIRIMKYSLQILLILLLILSLFFIADISSMTSCIHSFIDWNIRVNGFCVWICLLEKNHLLNE